MHITCCKSYLVFCLRCQASLPQIRAREFSGACNAAGGPLVAGRGSGNHNLGNIGTSRDAFLHQQPQQRQKELENLILCMLLCNFVHLPRCLRCRFLRFLRNHKEKCCNQTIQLNLLLNLCCCVDLLKKICCINLLI